MMLSIFPHNKSRSCLIPTVAAFCFFIALNCFAADVKLSWDANSESTGYKVYQGTESGTRGGSTDVGNVLEHIITGLEEGTTYYFTVTGYNANGFESDYADEVNNKGPSGKIEGLKISIVITIGQ